jgi:hypothetical protein
MRRNDPRFSYSVPVPELWHPEDVIWLRRSFVGALMNRAKGGENPHELVRARAELTDDDVARFWNDFVPVVSSKDRRTFDSLKGALSELRAAFTPEDLYAFERLAGRYTLLLAAKLESRFLEPGIAPALRGESAIPNVKTFLHLRLLAFHILCEGRARYDEACCSEDAALGHAKHLTLTTGSYLLALFNYESFVYQSQKLRAHQAFTEHRGREPLTEKAAEALVKTEAVLANLWGAMEMMPFLRSQFAAPEHADIPENWPHFRLTEDDEVVRDAP